MNLFLFTKGTKKHEISDKNRDNCKKEVNYIYDILLKIRDVFNQNPNIKQYRKNLTLEFIEIYENFENIQEFLKNCVKLSDMVF